MGCLESLESAASEPRSWWNLELVGREIRVAPLWKSWLQWFVSFFTDQLKRDLRATVGSLSGRIEVVLGNERPEFQIAVEKVSRLVHQKQSWLFEAAELPDPPRTSLEFLEKIPSSKQPYEEGGRYYNERGEKVWAQFLETLYLLFPGGLSSPSDEDLKVWNREEWVPCARSQEPQVTWLGHSSLLIQGANINLVFDLTRGFVSPCFLRHTEPPISAAEFPLADVVSISHNHGDHFAKDALEMGIFDPVAFVPKGDEFRFEGHGYEKIAGVEWWERWAVKRDGQQIVLTAIPARHGSQTSLGDLNRSLWMGVMIEVEGMKLYFAGDTGFDQEIFDQVKAHFGEVDIAFLPIAPEGEEGMHLNHQQALDVFEFLGAKKMFPIHHGAYRTGTEKIEGPLGLLTTAATGRGLMDRILFPKLGETVGLAPVVAQKAVS